MERPISFLEYKEQESNLILPEHNDDDDDDDITVLSIYIPKTSNCRRDTVEAFTLPGCCET